MKKGEKRKNESREWEEDRQRKIERSERKRKRQIAKEIQRRARERERGILQLVRVTLFNCSAGISPTSVTQRCYEYEESFGKSEEVAYFQSRIQWSGKLCLDVSLYCFLSNIPFEELFKNWYDARKFFNKKRFWVQKKPLEIKTYVGQTWSMRVAHFTR